MLELRGWTAEPGSVQGCAHTHGVQTTGEATEMFPHVHLPAHAALGRLLSWGSAHFPGQFPSQLPSHRWRLRLPSPTHTEPRYLVNDQLALEDGQEVCGLLAHRHAHLHSLVPMLLVQLDGVEGAGSDFIHRGMTTLAKKDSSHAT